MNWQYTKKPSTPIFSPCAVRKMHHLLNRDDQLVLLREDTSMKQQYTRKPLVLNYANGRRIARSFVKNSVSKHISHLLADSDEVRTPGTIWNTVDDYLSVAVDLTSLPAILMRIL
ncbi:unnamed protein product [Ceratitis capitata]|uniref:(Mediterranean fruit fly) hypothetical protein n=1 Tax=Ceratitis capitata TaxID=7213 RepID=A0A811USD3_CERCA|nr:unnamed protein product [Ceratitis capitata]